MKTQAKSSDIQQQIGEDLRGKTGYRWEENLPPRGSTRGPPKTSERYTGNED